VTYEFLYISECPVALKGRDLQSKLWSQVSFQNPKSVFRRMDKKLELWHRAP
jgi:hypothetical protein